MAIAGRPTSAGLGRRLGPSSAFATLSASSAERKCEPFFTNSRFASSTIAASTTTELGDEHRTPLSNVLPVTTSSTALGTSAELSIYDGALPGPTPYAGLPAE